jgi:NADH-quinone oxidoreductase subunit G
MLGLDSEPVNQGWLCDKGRFSIGAVNSSNRLTTPLVRRDGDLVGASWGEALEAAASGLRAARDLHGADTLAVLGGSRLADEDAYAWAKLAKGVLGTDNVDCQLGDGLPAEVVLGLPRATIDDAMWADTVVLLGPDLREELPVLFLRLRQAAVENGVRLVELTSHASGLTPHAAVSLLHQPGSAPAVMAALLAGSDPTEAVAGVAVEALKRGRELLHGDRSTVVVLGRPSLAESADHTTAAALALHEARPSARFLPALRRGNVHGALELGLAPGVLPGATSLEDGSARFAEAWGAVPAARGLDATDTLLAASSGRIHGLVLVGSDPLTDHPDRWLARRGLSGAGFVVAVDAFRTPSVEQADVVLPVAIWGERAGTTTNIEGRVTRLGQKVVPPGVAWADWMVASELAVALGGDLGVDSLAAIAEEIERLAPSRAGLTRAAIEDRANRDGLVALGSDDSRPEPSEVEANDDPGVAAVEAHVETGAPVGVGAETGGEAAGETAAATALPDAPRLHVPAARAHPPVKPDSYKLRLVTSRTLYDGGTIVLESDALAKLAPQPTLHVHPSDLNRFSLGDGELVRVTSSRFTSTLTAVADPGLPRGACWLAFSLGTPGAADLIDVAEPVTDLAVESA